MLFFIIGFLLGGTGGVLCMCMLQLNRLSKMEEEYREKSKRADSFPS